MNNPPLSGMTILEAVSPHCPPAIRLATALSGRIAADLGAAVLRLSDEADTAFWNAEEMKPDATFLHPGKCLIPIDDVGGATTIGRVDGLIRDSVSGPRPDLSPRAQVILMMAGRTGTARAPVTEFTAMAQAGLLDIVGEPDREPLRLGGHQLASAAGLAGFTALAASLCAPDTSKALIAEVNLLDVGIWLNWKSVVAANEAGRPPHRAGRDSEWQILPCADGWAALVYRDWAAFRRAVTDPRLDDPRFETRSSRIKHSAMIADIVGDTFRQLTRKEVSEIARLYRIPLGPVWNPSEILVDAQSVARSFFHPVRAGDATTLIPRIPMLWNGKPFPPGRRRGGAGVRAPSHHHEVRSAVGTATEKPLAGYRVLDLGIITAGAATGAILADLGAEVIKIEAPSYKDPFRQWAGDRPADVSWTVSPLFTATNRNKLSVSLDLKRPSGRAAFLRLARHCHVVVENFRRGVLEDLGIGYNTLQAANSKIVLASISSQGDTGPEAGQISYGSTLEAVGGLSWRTGYAADAPMITGVDLNYPDQVGAIFAAGMIVTALLASQHGGGVHLDISQRELTSFLSGEMFADASVSLKARIGNAQPPYVFQDCLKAADGRWVAVSIGEEDTAAIAILSRDGIRPATSEECRAILSRWIAMHDATACVEQFASLNVAAAVAVDGTEVLAARAWSAAMATSPSGSLVKGFPFQFTEMPMEVFREIPPFGADTEDVLRRIGGLSVEDIRELAADGAIQEPNALGFVKATSTI